MTPDRDALRDRLDELEAETAADDLVVVIERRAHPDADTNPLPPDRRRRTVTATTGEGDT